MVAQAFYAVFKFLLKHRAFAFFCVNKTFGTLEFTVVFVFELHKVLLFGTCIPVSGLSYANFISCRKCKTTRGDFLKPLVHVINRLACVVFYNCF